MKSEKIYDDWKKQRSHVEVRQNFTERAMNQIYQYEQNKRKPLFDMQRLVEFVSVHPLAKAGLIAVGAVTGFVRVAFMIHVLLFGN